PPARPASGSRGPGPCSGCSMACRSSTRASPSASSRRSTSRAAAPSSRSTPRACATPSACPSSTSSAAPPLCDRGPRAAVPPDVGAQPSLLLPMPWPPCPKRDRRDADKRAVPKSPSDRRAESSRYAGSSAFTVLRSSRYLELAAEARSKPRGSTMALTMTKEEREAFLSDIHVAVISVAEDGHGPLVVPIWYSYEPGGEVRIITGRASRKGKLLERAGRFSLWRANGNAAV